MDITRPIPGTYQQEDTMSDTNTLSMNMINGEYMAREDIAGLSVRRLELLDDELEGQMELSEPAQDIEADVNKLVELDVQVCEARKARDWERFHELKDEFSALSTGNPAYGRYKALKEGKEMDSFISSMPEDKEEGLSFPDYWEALAMAHVEEQKLYAAPETDASAWPFFRVGEYVQARRDYYDCVAFHKLLLQERQDLLHKRAQAQAWLERAATVHDRERRVKELKAKVKELGLRSLQVVEDELADSDQFLAKRRAELGIPSYQAHMARKRYLRSLVGKTFPAPVKF